MPSKRCVAIRIGNPALLPWINAQNTGRWSTEESSTQHARDLFMEGHEVILVFLGTGDRPVGVANLTNVRARNNEIDRALFPEGQNLDTIMEFSNYVSVLNCMYDTSLFGPLLSEIRFSRGPQVIVSQATAGPVFHFYMGATTGVQGQPQNIVVNQPVRNTNATYNIVG